MIALLGCVSAALTLSTVLTSIELRSSLRRRGETTLRQVLTLQEKAYTNYLEDLREATMVAGLSGQVEQSFPALNAAFGSLEGDINRAALSSQAQRRLLVPLSTRSDQYASGLTAESLLPASPQGLALQQAYVAPAAIPPERLIRWRGPGLSSYDRVYAALHDELYPMLHAFGLYDIFLVNTRGDVIFSVAKEFDLGTNLLTGPYADSGLGVVFRELINNSAGRTSTLSQDREREVRISSVGPYLPSMGAPSVFTGIPVYLKGVLQGYLCAQVDFSDFLSTLNANQNWKGIGLGATGDLLLLDRRRTQMSVPRPLHQNRSLALSKLARGQSLTEEQLKRVRSSPLSAGLLIEQGPAVESVLAGSSGLSRRRNLFGDEVLAAWTPVPPLSSADGNQSWGLLAEISVSELYAPLRSLLWSSAINALLTLGASALLGLWLSKRLVSPLLRVQSLTRELLSCGYDSPQARLIPQQLRDVASSTGTEVGVLANDLAKLDEDFFGGLDAIQATNATVESLSAPISAIRKGVLLLPLIGHLDLARAERVRDQALQLIVQHRASYFIWDLAGLVDVEGGIASYLSGVSQAARLLGARSIFSGVTPRLASQLSADRLVLGDVLSTSSLEDALALTVHQ
ncbi:STAS domain-containing protein [Vulcanococcus sp.]|uniref:STAS domain-containing protein n=1 Tax=Vulcanococcus sp. TaxID=2856995 RepID=UPI003C07E79A